MGSYSDALNEELKTTTLKKSFVRADEQSHGDNKVIFYLKNLMYQIYHHDLFGLYFETLCLISVHRS